MVEVMKSMEKLWWKKMKYQTGKLNELSFATSSGGFMQLVMPINKSNDNFTLLTGFFIEHLIRSNRTSDLLEIFMLGFFSLPITFGDFVSVTKKN